MVSVSDTMENNNEESLYEVPSLEVGEFDGNIRKWLDWYDRFRLLIHENKSLPSPVNTWLYLKSYLTGEAKEKTNSLYYCSAADYPLCLEMLERCYGEPHALARMYFKDLEAIPQVSADDCISLRSALTDATIAVRFLRRCKNAFDYFEENRVIKLIMEKFPKEMILQIIEANPGWGLKIDALLDMLEKKIEAVEFYAYILDLPNPINKPVTPEEKTPTDSTPKKPKAKPKPRMCMFCKEGHSSYSCGKYKTVKARCDKLTQLKRCLVCACGTSSSHNSNNCRFKTRACKYCKARGHSRPLCAKLLKKRFKKK